MGAGDAALHAHAAAAAARADVESAALLYRLHPDERALTAAGGYLLYDSPAAVAHLRAPRAVGPLRTAAHHDGRLARREQPHRRCRTRSRTDALHADDRTAVTLAGDTRLHGTLRLPQNGLTYGRVGAEFYRGEEVPARRSAARQRCFPHLRLPSRHGSAHSSLSRSSCRPPAICPTASAYRSAIRPSPCASARPRSAATLRGRIVLAADELRIDSACRLENVLVCARKITVGSGARIAAQLFARDTVVVEPCAVLEYPSGICAGRYAELGDRATADGYVIVRDTVRHKKMAASYRQSRTARVRGLLHADGAAQVQGIVAGVRSSDRPSTSRRRDTTGICSTTLRCSKIPPRRNRCGTAAPRPCAEREAVCVE